MMMSMSTQIVQETTQDIDPDVKREWLLNMFSRHYDREPSGAKHFNFCENFPFDRGDLHIVRGESEKALCGVSPGTRLPTVTMSEDRISGKDTCPRCRELFWKMLEEIE